MIEPLLLKLAARDRVLEEERQVLASSAGRVREVGGREDLVRPGDRPTESCLIVEGVAARYRLFETGRRQITEFHLAGDFVDLHSFLLKVMDHGVVTLSRCRVVYVPHERLRDITERHPHLTRLLWLSTLIDGAIHREWLAGAGRRNAASQMAHLICELFTRLEVVHLTRGTAFRFPVTQAELGDALGLSTVHTNRTLQELRAEGLITWRGDEIKIEDLDRLRAVAEFDPAYLHIYREPR